MIVGPWGARIESDLGCRAIQRAIRVALVGIRIGRCHKKTAERRLLATAFGIGNADFIATGVVG